MSPMPLCPLSPLFLHNVGLVSTPLWANLIADSPGQRTPSFQTGGALSTCGLGQANDTDGGTDISGL